MRKTRRWLALLLAVVLVSSNVIYQLGTDMSASESENVTEEAEQKSDSTEEKVQKEEVPDTQDQKDSGEATVQELDSHSKRAASDDSAKARTVEKAKSAEKTETKSEEKKEQTAKKEESKKADATDSDSKETKKDTEEKSYEMTIQKSELDGGSIKAWGANGSKETVTYKDSKYLKTVKSGEDFHFEITVKDSFKLDKVTDQHNNTIQPQKVEGNVYTYRVADVKADKTFHVLYKEETGSKKNDSDNAKSDNKQDDADASDDEESDSKADEDKNVSVASEKGKIATVADTDTNKTIHVDETVGLRNDYEDNYFVSYKHDWNVTFGADCITLSGSGNRATVKGVKAGNATVTDTITWGRSGKKVITYTVHVIDNVSPTAISISGADKVTQFKTTQLTANLTPADASGNVTWTSSNEQILSVDDNGLVTAKRQGSATVTASVQGTAKATLSATKTIEVVKNESPTNKREALVYYLKDPTKDANSNASSEWGPNPIGTAVVNVEGATWTSGKNCFDNVDQRVVSWPTTLNGNVIPKSNNAWQLIFNAYKAKIERELGVTITEDDVEEISLVPAKISKDNGTTPDMHLDCNVNIKCKKVALIKYWLFDANGTNWEMLGSKNYLVKDGSTTKPSDVTSKDFPKTKTVNGVTYTFSGWYTDQSLTTPAPSFPAEVTGAANYYAKYVAGYQVMYNLAGGKFSDGSTTATEKHNVDTDVVVKEQPTRAGYKFIGWKVEGLSGTTTINSGDTFTMPNGNVTLTAQWEKKDIKDYVTLNTQNVTEEYNGKPHAAGEATAVPKTGKENEVGTLKVEYQKANGDWTTDCKEITAKDVSDSKTVNVRVTSTDLVGELTGTEKLTITKKAVTLTSASDSKTYDGTALTNHNVTAEGFVKDEGASYNVTGTITDAGNTKNTFTYNLNSNTKEDNYNITKEEGTLEVTPVTDKVTVTIKGETKTVTYDGDEYSVKGYKTSIDNNLYKESDFKFSGKAEAKGTDAKKSYQMGLETSQFENKSANFTNVTFVVTDGSLTINKRPVILKSASDSKVYDKTALTNHKVTAEGFVKDQGATYDVTGSQTEVGDSNNTFTYTLKDNTKADNYEITKSEGKLTVTADENAIVVTIKGENKTETYNGTEQSVTGYDVVSIQHDGKAYSKYTTDDFAFSGKAEAKGTDAGSYPMGLTKEQFSNTNNNFTNVTFVVTDGNLTISKRDVTLESASTEKEYDGTALESKTVTVTSGSFVKGEEPEYNVTGSQTEVGYSGNTFTYSKSGIDYSKNYNITKTEGKLTVKKNKSTEVVVTITGNTASKMYNGAEQSITGYTVETHNDLYTEADFTFKGNDENKTAKGSNVATYAMGLKAEQFINTSKNFENVKFEVTDGKLDITKRSVTLTSGSAERPYNGEALKNSEVKVTGDGFVEGEGATYNVTGTITDAGEVDNAFAYNLNDNTKADNYKITKTEGKLKVTPVTDKVTVTITGNTDTQKYNGEYHAVSGYTASYSNTLYTAADYAFSGVANINQKDAGTYAMGLNAEQFKNTSSNFINVEFVVTDGQLVITPREVTLTSEGATKVYDGEPLTNKNVTVSGDGFVEGEGATYSVTGSQTKAGTSKNTFTYSLKNNTKPQNYTINKVEGDLVVTQDKDEVVVTITGHTAEAKYNGEAHTAEGYDVSINNEKYHASDFTFKGTANVTEKNAGEYAMGLKESDFVNNSTDFEKVTFVVTDGKLTITKRNVTLTSGTASKVYDGTPLTAKTVSIDGDGFVTGEGATCTVTGTQTNVGDSENTFLYELYTQNGTNANVANNYNITPVFGKLKVTKQSIDPKDPDNTLGIKINDPSDHVYDGKDHKWVPEVKDKNNKVLVEGTDYTVSYDTENFKDVKTIKVTITGTGNYDGTVEKTYQITKRPVTLTSASAEKVYDGNALTKKEVTASKGENEGFVDGEGAEFTVTGKQTVVGSSDNTFDYKLKNGTSGDNYDIKVANGTLKVTPVTNEVTVTITENSDALTYDGEEHTVKGYKVTDISNKLYKEGDFSFNGKAEVKGTNAGTYTMELKPENFKNESANFSNVKFVIVDGTLKINPKEVTLTSASATKMYDGKPLTKEEVTATGFVGNDGATYSNFANRTDVGKTDNTFDYDLKEGTLEGNYNIKVENGTLEVTSSDELITVKIKENSGNLKYDGTEKNVTGYTVTDISNKLYKEGDFTFSGNAEVKGTNAGTYNMELKPEDFTNTNKNFSKVSFVIEDGTLTIAPRNVTLTSASKSKAYDGKPLTDSTVTVSGDGFAEGEGATYNVTGSQTNVGTSDNTFTYTLNNGTKQANYNITPVSGKLTVTKDEKQVVVTITEKSDTVKYDGKEHTVKGYEVTDISNPLYEKTDFTFDGNDEVKGTKAGIYEMKLTSKDFHNTNENFKDVKFNIVDGKLTIEKRTVVMTSASQNKVYDGKALENKTVTETGDGFIEGEGATYKVTGSQTNVGKSANKFTYALNKGTDKDNYTIETHNGELEVTPVKEKVTVTIKENSGTVTYDGAPHEVTGYEVKNISNTLYTANDFTFSGEAKAEGTDAGTYEMKVNASDFKNTSKNFSDVEFVVEDGKLTIEKRKVTLTSANDKKVYDGTALKNDEVTVSGDGFAKDEGATYDVTGTITNVGEKANAFTYKLNKGTKADNYDIEKTEGTLKVTPVTDKVTVKIKGHTGTFKYDGEKKKVEGYDVTIDNDLYKESDINFKGTDKVEEINANTYAMGLAASDFENISDNFSNVLFEVEDGQLMIEKRNVKLTSATDSKVYDGEALTNDEVTVDGDKFAKGEGATYDVTGTITNKGSVDNAFTYKLNDNTNADNYNIEVAFGKLSITADKKEVVVTITENSGVAKYDGTAKSVTGYKVTNISNKLYKEKDFTFSGNAKVEATDAGTYDMELKPEDFANTNENFDKVTFVIVDGTLAIQKRNVTLTSADASQVYNGKALTNDTVTVGGEGFAKGEGATYDVTGTITNVGEKANTFTYKLNEGTKASNYVIETAEGTLKVTPVTDEVVVNVKENSGKEKYDGAEKTVEGYKVTNISNNLYKEADIKFNGNAKVSGTDAGTYDMDVKATDFENTSKNFSKVKFVVEDGQLIIEKRNVTLTSADDEKVYDGKALTNDKVTVGGEGFAKGEGATYDVTGTQTNVGESKNTFTYKLNEGTKTDNYVIETAEGTLKVTPVTDEVVVTITGNDADATYDGKEHTAKGYEVDINNKLYTEDDFTFNGEAEVSGTDAGTYRMDMTSDNFTNNSDNFANVKFVVTNGELNIAKRNVILTSASDSKAYDGKALTNDEVTVGGDEFAEGEGAEFTVTGSQLDAGTSDNVFEYALKDGTNADNYTIEVVYGKLTVTADENEVVVTITENRGRNKYDGRKHKVTGYEVTAISNKLYTEKDFTFNGKAEVTGTDAGTYNMNVKAADFKNTNANFDKVTFVIIDGTLTIEKRNVTMTSANASKQYDGRALTSNKVTVSGDGFVRGEGATYDVTGTRTSVGTSTNAFTYKLNNGTKASNYNIKKVEGKLIVTARNTNGPSDTNPSNDPTPPRRDIIEVITTAIKNVPRKISEKIHNRHAKVREIVKDKGEDEKVPLGKDKLENHDCCMLHFLIMLLAAILYGLFTHNLKKRQKELFEVREELDTELARRGLPTTKEQKEL